MAHDDLRRQIAFFVECDKMKSIQRRTQLIDGSRCENDAEHSWELALMAIVLQGYSNAPVNMLRVLKMVIVHDIVEIDAGDTFIYDTEAGADQRDRERTAADRIFGILPEPQGREFRALWEEFEARETDDAKFARALDRFQPLLHNFLTRGGTWRTPGVGPGEVLEKKRPISDGSDLLWSVTNDIVAEGVRRGYLRE
ncbi:MAG: phosphohydrolase [Rhodovulum sulfidophilum]|uniref:Phosphohydrolase n=1 Tax=Rhodovulum sulfidophilum TaxID=35806 RepID=A0A2W5MY82_RHOSU|nr:MAG: phosphohydrolase [Rhodovulum sulfidophilum]